MKKGNLLFTIFVVVLLAVGTTVPAHAQAGWFVAGWLLGSSSGDNIQGGASGEVLYVVDSVVAKVINPLEVRTTTLKVDYDYGHVKRGISLGEIFEQAMNELFYEYAEKKEYIPLRISRVVSFKPGEQCVYWIEFTARSNFSK